MSYCLVSNCSISVSYSKCTDNPPVVFRDSGKCHRLDSWRFDPNCVVVVVVVVVGT